MRWGALLENLHYLENCVTWKIVTLKNCCTWKTVFFKKLRCFENCDTWKTALLWKIALLVKLRYFENCNTWKTVILEKLCYLKNWLVFWITMLLEKVLRWGALLVKYCVGVRYIKILLYCKILRCLKTDFLWKLRY